MQPSISNYEQKNEKKRKKEKNIKRWLSKHTHNIYKHTHYKLQLIAE